MAITIFVLMLSYLVYTGYPTEEQERAYDKLEDLPIIGTHIGERNNWIRVEVTEGTKGDTIFLVKGGVSYRNIFIPLTWYQKISLWRHARSIEKNIRSAHMIRQEAFDRKAFLAWLEKDE